MNVVGISMMKDEADVVDDVVRHMLANVDELIIADNGSTDGTREKLKEFSRDYPVHLRDDPEVGYYQSRKMSALAHDAVMTCGAEWVIPFDADEVWLPAYQPHKRDRSTLKEVLERLPDNERIAKATLYDHVATAEDPKGVSPFHAMRYRRVKPLPLPKVAARATSPVIIEQGNHGANYGVAAPNPVLEVRHFPLRSAEHMIRKARNGAAAYAATDLDHSLGAHWRDWGKLSDDQLREAFHRYYFSENPRKVAGLRRDPVLLL